MIDYSLILRKSMRENKVAKIIKKKRIPKAPNRIEIRSKIKKELRLKAVKTKYFRFVFKSSNDSVFGGVLALRRLVV
jgi:hypothetical protein